MGSIETIEIKCGYDGVDGIEVLSIQAVVFGNWAAHPMEAMSGTSFDWWSVTHVPSGMAVHAFEPWRAIAIAEDLLRTNATFADPAKPSASESAVCKAVIEKWRSR